MTWLARHQKTIRKLRFLLGVVSLVFLLLFAVSLIRPTGFWYGPAANAEIRPGEPAAWVVQLERGYVRVLHQWGANASISFDTIEMTMTQSRLNNAEQALSARKDAWNDLEAKFKESGHADDETLAAFHRSISTRSERRALPPPESVDAKYLERLRKRKLAADAADDAVVAEARRALKAFERPVTWALRSRWGSWFDTLSTLQYRRKAMLFGDTSTDGISRTVTVSFLPFFALFAIAWFTLRQAKRAIPPGHCPECGYDLRATPTRCPECGALPPSTTPTPTVTSVPLDAR